MAILHVINLVSTDQASRDECETQSTCGQSISRPRACDSQGTKAGPYREKEKEQKVVYSFMNLACPVHFLYIINH